jgi:hypothetical protein
LLQWDALSIRTGSVLNATKLPAAFTYSFLVYYQLFYQLFYQESFIMGRRGPELDLQMQARICELRSIKWSYNKIHAQHPDIPRTTIADTCRREALRLKNHSLSRPGPPRVISEEQRNMLYDAAITAPAISYEALKAQVGTTASIRSIKRLFQDMNIRKRRKTSRSACVRKIACSFQLQYTDRTNQLAADSVSEPAPLTDHGCLL